MDRCPPPPLGISDQSLMGLGSDGARRGAVAIVVYRNYLYFRICCSQTPREVTVATQSPIHR